MVVTEFLSFFCNPVPLHFVHVCVMYRDEYMASHALTLEQEELDRVNLALANIQPFNKGRIHYSPHQNNTSFTLL